LRLHVHERDVVLVAERLDNLFRLVLAHHPVVDEHARELGRRRLCARATRQRPSRQPPDNAQRMRSEPTCARMRSTCSSMTAAGVQAGGASAMS